MNDKLNVKFTKYCRDGDIFTNLWEDDLNKEIMSYKDKDIPLEKREIFIAALHDVIKQINEDPVERYNGIYDDIKHECENSARNWGEIREAFCKQEYNKLIKGEHSYYTRFLDDGFDLEKTLKKHAEYDRTLWEDKCECFVSCAYDSFNGWYSGDLLRKLDRDLDNYAAGVYETITENTVKYAKAITGLDFELADKMLEELKKQREEEEIENLWCKCLVNFEFLEICEILGFKLAVNASDAQPLLTLLKN